MARRPRRRRTVDLERYRAIVPDWDAFTEAASRPEPTVCRLRVGRVPEDELVARLEGQGFTLRPLAGMPSFYEVEEGPRPVSMTLEHWLGLLYVQQASTGAAAPALGAAAGERVLDLCSAPGGKTTHLCELMQDRGCVVASEIDERRIRGLLGNVYRLGHTNVMAVACDGRAFPEGVLFDRVLVDAPCSGEGTLRRRTGEAPKQSRSFLAYVTRVQRALLEKAIRLTRPGGTVLYVTCTFSPEENEGVVSDVLSRAPAEVEPIDLPVPHARGLTSFENERFDSRLEGAVRIYPHHLDSGGLFMAKLRRLGEEDPDTGWTRIPAAFPDGALDEEAARALVTDAVSTIESRYGVETRESWDWIVRGGRVWVHSAGEWPLTAWPEGAWRPISIGIRAIEFDSKRRPRPTNDLLRRAGVSDTGDVVDVGLADLRSLLERRTVPLDRAQRGPVTLRFTGDVIGRGAVTGRGLESEVPKSRAAELARVLA